jgi:hypothetical protein
MAIETLAEELVQTALTFAPWLSDIPVLGRILSLFAPDGGNDIKALEALQAAAKKKETDRATRIKKNARYVLKASEAMKCVEHSLGNGAFLLSLGQALLNTVAGRSAGVSAPDLLMDRIFSCIESKVLSQESKRVKVEKAFYHRPARGHGKGRESF